MAKLLQADAEKKIFELTEKLLFTKKDYKDVAAGYKERIKELEGEIQAIVEEQETINIKDEKIDVDGKE